MGRRLAPRVGDAERYAQPVAGEGIGIESRRARAILPELVSYSLLDRGGQDALPISNGRGVRMSTVLASPPSSRSAVGDL